LDAHSKLKTGFFLIVVWFFF